MRHFARAVELREDLTRRPGAGAATRVDLANSLYTLGYYNFRFGQSGEGFRCWDRALAEREAAARAAPENLTIATDLGGLFNDLGVKLAEAGRHREAVERFDSAVATLGRVLARDAERPRTRGVLAFGHAKRGWSLSRLNRHPDALADFGRALDLATPQQQTGIRLARAAVLARSGDHAGAAAEMDAVTKGGIKSPGERVAAARVLALEAARNPEAAADLRRRAVVLLREAVTGGYERLDLLKQDEDFAALHHDDEFRTLTSTK